MARKIVATGFAVAAAGGRVFELYLGIDPVTGYPMTGIPHLIENAGFAWAAVAHTFYEVGDVGFIDENIVTAFGAAVPLGSTQVGGGTFWVPTSTHPPGLGIWPNGATRIELTTTDRQMRGSRTGYIKKARNGNRVYRAEDLVIWIPTAALVAPPAGLGVPTQSIWNIDF